MQPFSSTHVPLSGAPGNPHLNEPAKTNPTGTLGKFAVAVQSGVTTFFRSLSPNYVPEHQRQISQPAAPVASNVPAGNINDNTSLSDSVVQGVGLVGRALSCWVPNASAVGDAIGTICSSISLVNRLDDMAMSGKSGASGKKPASGSENVSKHSSQKVTDKKQEDEKPGKSATASSTTSRISGPAMATATLMAMDRLAGAAALPAEGRPGAWNNPIPVEDSATLGKIGRNDSFPMDAYYQQTRSFSHNTSVPVGDDNKPFQGYYDGGCHTISDLKDCLFYELGFGADVKNLRIANTTIDQPDKQHSAVLACEMSGGSVVSGVRVEHGNVSTRQGGKSAASTAGVITGLQGEESVLKDIEIVDCSVTTSGHNTYTGAGAGWVDGDIERMTVADSQVTSTGDSASAAIGGGLVTGRIKQLTVVNSQVTTTGKNGNGAIGGGQVGRLHPPANGQVSGLVALNSHVNTTNNFAAAGIGAGFVANEHSEVNGITAIECSVSTSQKNSWAAIGAGMNLGRVTDITAVNSSVNGLTADIGSNQVANLGSVTGTASMDSRVNGELKNIGNVTLPGLCRTADAQFVTSDCQMTPDSAGKEHWNCSSTPPAAPGTTPQPMTTPVSETVTAKPITQPTSDTQTTLPAINKTVMSPTGSKPLSGTPRARHKPILVADSETLGKIGQPGFPPDGHYLQTKSFSHKGGVAIGNGSAPFTGDYDGGCNTISDSEGCLLDKLGRNAVVHDLHVAGAAIKNGDSRSAVLACEMGEQSTVRDIFIEDASVINHRASSRTDSSYTGVITGLQQPGSLIAGADVKNSSVTTSGNYSPAGIGSGKTHGQVRNMNVADSQVTTSGRYSDAGIGAGEMAGQIEHLAVTDSWVETRGGRANSGIGGGKITGDIGHLTVLSSNVSTLQIGADAGIGGGEVAGDIRNMTVVNSRVTTKGIVAHAGIGGGQVGNRRSLSLGGIGGGKLIEGSVNDLIALDSHVRTEGRSAHAGIGGGVVNDEVRGVSAINCSVSAENGKAGIGAGLYNSGSAADIRSLNSKVNGKLQNSGTEDSYELCRSADSRFVTDDCQLTPDSLTEDHWNWNCSATSIVSASVRSAAHRPFPQPASASVNNTVMADTTSQQPAVSSLNETAVANTARRLSSHTLSTPAPRNDMAMANTTTLLPSQILAAPAPLNQMVMSNTTITGHTMATPLPSINATITTTPPLAAAAMATPAAVMETVVTLPEASMTFAGMPPATALPTTPPPLAETLNIGIVLGASFGTAFTILAGIGLCALYQYCHRRNEARKQAEPEVSRPITDSTRV